MATPTPTLRYERELLRSRSEWTLLGGLDEVGRGALAGPVSVGLVVVAEHTRTAPAGVRDSKLLAPAARERLEPRLRRWGLARAVGHASPAEIDEVGILAALRLAARRALAVVTDAGCAPDVLLLDGSHDWFTDPARVGLFAELSGGDEAPIPVVTRVKADMRCASVAAASVIAKVERDAMMRELAAGDASLEHYGFAVNKGYSAPAHLDALRLHGPSVHHRRSWRLPTATDPVAVGSSEAAGSAVRPVAGAIDPAGAGEEPDILGHNGASRDEGETTA